MLEEIMDYIHNYFEQAICRGTFTISSSSLQDVDFLQEGQYFRILGSVFNDGIYQYPCNSLIDEQFTGEIWALAIPQRVVALAEEITAWNEKYSDTLNSPYQSESFGGYSYTKRAGNSSGGSDTLSWKTQFKSQLNHWRKIA